MKCKICAAQSAKIFNARIMNKYDIDYFLCPTCGFLQTEDPHWLKESYAKGAISSLDTGVLTRNLYFSKVTSAIIYFLCNPKESFLDYGGGHGIFTRLMRDRGFDFYWHDPYGDNIFSRGFEGQVDGARKYEALTSFENFEHFVDPMLEIEKLIGLTDTVIFSTVLLPPEIPKPEKWCYYCLGHGQHVSLYSHKTLAFIAQKYHLNLYTHRMGYHMFSRRRLSAFQFDLIIKLTTWGLSNITRLPSRTDADYVAMGKILQGV